jgi:hypothetical protein
MASFISKVPNCEKLKILNQENPGPGSYLKDDKGYSKFSSTGSVNGANGNDIAFLNTTHRVDFWSNEIDTPYTKQTFMKNPGPGSYNLGKKKGDDIKSKLLVEETVHVPFGSSNEREVNKKFKTTGPGPGTYIDINNPNNSSICKSLNKNKDDRALVESQGIKIGAFGSTQ